MKPFVAISCNCLLDDHAYILLRVDLVWSVLEEKISIPSKF